MTRTTRIRQATNSYSPAFSATNRGKNPSNSTTSHQTVDGNPVDSRKDPNPPSTSPGRPIPKLSAESQVLYDLITRIDISVRQISSEIALLRTELAQKPSYEEMHKYVDGAFLDLNSRLQKIEEKYTQTSQQTDEIREIVREETFCHHEAQRRKMNIIVKNLPEQEGVDDVTQVKQIIQNQLQLPVPTILKATRLGEKKPTTQNSVSRYQPLLIQLPESEIALKRQIVQMSYVKRKSLQTFFRNDVPKRFRTAGSISEPLSRGPKN